MFKILKRVRCKHDNLECISNIYGDMIHAMSSSKMTVRSVWKCKNCGKVICKGELNPGCKVSNFKVESESN